MRITTPELSVKVDLETKDTPVKDETAREIEASTKDTAMTEDAVSKKRSHEDDSTEEGQGRAKKVDVKEGSE